MMSMLTFTPLILCPFLLVHFSCKCLVHFRLALTLRKISNLTWDELYKDQGLKWEVIISKTTKTNDRIYSFRFSQKYRALALREEAYLRLLTLHPDHDSAYKK